MKYLGTLLATFLLLFTYTSTASKFESFENGLPNYATASRPAGISTSGLHYKSGRKSLKWNWHRGDSITIKHGLGNLKQEGGYGGTYSKATFGVWVYCESPTNDSLKFEFRTGNKSNAYFTFPLDFTGWRRANLRYSWKQQFKGKVSPKTDNIKITAPQKTAKGTCFIDLLVYNGVMDFRQQFVPDFHHWKPETIDSSKYPLPRTVTPKQLKAIDKIGKIYEKIYLKNNKPLTTKRFNNLKQQFKAFNIVSDAKGIRGNPLLGIGKHWSLDIYTKNGVPDTLFPAKLTDLMHKIALAWHSTQNKSQREQLEKWYILLGKHFADQGFVANSGNPWGWYYGRNLAEATFLMRKPLKEHNFLKTAAVYFDYNYGFSKIFNDKTVNPCMDSFHQNTPYRLLGALMQPTNQEVVRALNAFSNYLSKEILFEGANGYKPDGSAFHHGGHYFGYFRYSSKGLITVVNALAGTEFAINDSAYNQLKKALLNARFYANKYVVPLPLQGRHPYEKNNTLIEQSYILMAQASPNGFDKELGAVYLRLMPKAASKPQFQKHGIKPEKDPNGNLTMNFAGFTAHRRGNWLALAKGYSKYVWNTEIYAKLNRYGRNLSYGSLQIVGSGNPVNLKDSGYVENGFDWNRIDGTTARYMTLKELRAQGPTQMIRSDRTFVGGVTHRGTNGAFVMRLHEIPFDQSFTAEKSYFFIDNMILCLGSDIINNDRKHFTQTNLFQRVLKSKNTPLVVNGKSITAFPAKGKLPKNKWNWLIDPQQTGYCIAPGNQVEYSRKTQNSRDQRDKKNTKGNFTCAWIDHGKAPRKASYQYFVFPQTNKAFMTDFANKMSSPATAPVKILKQNSTTHAIAYPAKNLWAAVLFKPQDTPFLPLVKKVSRRCLVMIEKAGDKYFLSVSDPDLEMAKRGKHGYYSRPRSVKLILNGKWQAVKPLSNLQVKHNSRDTLLDINSQNGLSYTIELKAK
jgi:chondroitin-sulfate-ABC endolyase/exolyase